MVISPERLTIEGAFTEIETRYPGAIGCCMIDGEMKGSIAGATPETRFFMGSVSKIPYFDAAFKFIQEQRIDPATLSIPYTTNSVNELKALNEIRGVREKASPPSRKNTLLAIAGATALKIKPHITNLTLEETVLLTVGYSANDSLIALIKYFDRNYTAQLSQQGFEVDHFRGYAQDHARKLLESAGIGDPRLTLRNVSADSQKGPANSASLSEVAKLFEVITKDHGSPPALQELLIRALGITAYPMLEFDIKNSPSLKPIGKAGEFRIITADEDNKLLTGQFESMGFDRTNPSYHNIMYVARLDGKTAVYAFVIPDKRPLKRHYTNNVSKDILSFIGQKMREAISYSIRPVL